MATDTIGTCTADAVSDGVADAVRQTAATYERVRHVIPEVEWATFAEDVVAIERLKREKDAVILAHNYQTPEIFHGVADIVGDSLALARRAQDVEAGTILLAGVHFMAETAKLLNPGKTVLVPDLRAGCSLADSITADDVRGLRERHPGVPVVTYVNTSAAVKAASDVCCTSAQMSAYVEQHRPSTVALITECSMSDNVAAGHPELTFIRPCNMCPHMKRSTLGGIRAALETGGPEVTLDPAVAADARRAVERMLELS